METVLTAADILPSAVHLTASTLSGMHPDKTFSGTQVGNMPYGEYEGDISIGSLDLILDDIRPILHRTGREAVSGTGMIRDGRSGAVIQVPKESQDLVIMNPPFTRPTNHGVTGVPVPSFAGFGTTEEEQVKMSVRLRKIREELGTPAGHGNAGIASNFIDLAHAKVRPGGVLALVLPAALVQGQAWKNARTLIRRYYHDILLVGIATNGRTDQAFSADTDMAEVLLVATRKMEPDEGISNLFMVNIFGRPRTPLEAAITARRIEQCRHGQTQDTGEIRLTEAQPAGSFFQSQDWTGFGIREASLVICMKALQRGNLLLPRMGTGVPVPVCELGELGRRGFLHRDISGREKRTGKVRGPFHLASLTQAPEYPILWAHTAERERQLVVLPDRQGVHRQGYREQAANLWHDGASRLHYTLDFTLSSQPLAACLTEQISLGGTAWPNFLTRMQWEIPLVLWANTTLGLMSFWWAGSRQQRGRSRLTITRLPQLLSIDARVLTREQLRHSEKIFDDFRGRDLCRQMKRTGMMFASRWIRRCWDPFWEWRSLFWTILPSSANSGVLNLVSMGARLPDLVCNGERLVHQVFAEFISHVEDPAA